MNLEALVGKNLDRIDPAGETVRRLLSGADRHIADAKVKAISAETRFVSAYTAIRMLGDLGLHVHGYRTRTSASGQHVIAIRALNLTLGVSERVVERLDQLRKLRNAIEYSGEVASTPAGAPIGDRVCITSMDAADGKPLIQS